MQLPHPWTVTSPKTAPKNPSHQRCCRSSCRRSSSSSSCWWWQFLCRSRPHGQQRGGGRGPPAGSVRGLKPSLVLLLQLSSSYTRWRPGHVLSHSHCTCTWCPAQSQTSADKILSKHCPLFSSTVFKDRNKWCSNNNKNKEYGYIQGWIYHFSSIPCNLTTASYNKRLRTTPDFPLKTIQNIKVGKKESQRDFKNLNTYNWIDNKKCLFWKNFMWYLEGIQHQSLVWIS